MQILRFTKDHEWIRLEDGVATVGISDYAQKALGDVVYVELPEEGRELAAGDEASVVESVKAASEVYAPASGEVIAVNSKLGDEPGLVNTDPMGAGWFVQMTLNDEAELDDLMDEDAYAEFLSELE